MCSYNFYFILSSSRYFNCGEIYSFKRQPPKIVKHTQTIRWLLLTNFLSVFDQFVGLAVKGLIIPFSHW